MDETQQFAGDSKRLRQYCMAFARFFFVIALVLIPYRWLRWRESLFNWTTLILLALGPALGVFLYLAYSFIFRGLRVELSRTGLLARRAFARPRGAPWADIDGARPFDLYGVPFLTLRVGGKWGKVIFPLWLDDLPRFQRTVEEYAGRDNALAGLLRDATSR